ncbi:MAG: GSCFA domain-containing protein [Bacteroidota bacterium]
MELQTKVRISPRKGLLTYESPILCLGSCFAEMIGNKLTEAKFITLQNPLGILYNPLSLANVMSMMLDSSQYPEWSYAPHLERWHSFELHSLMSHENKEELQARADTILRESRDFLKKAPLIILTFGTAVAYRHKEGGQIVGNCHKYPADTFQKELLDLTDMMATYHSLFQRLQTEFPDIKIMLTVSPIRHVRDTLQLNSVSKALLRVLCNQLAEAYEWVSYFPSFEIMMDELRDYRFYSSDMLHPSSVAENWIWEKFLHAYLNDKDGELLKRWEKIRQQLNHKPRYPNTATYKTFLEKLQQSLLNISGELDCEAELARIEELLIRHSA